MTVINTPALPLGKISPVPQDYDPALLYPIARQGTRPQNLAHLSQGQSRPFEGCDRWDCFEISWLDPHGLPQSAVAHISYGADSPYMVESKSLKLYLMGFHNSRYPGAQALAAIIATDLKAVLATEQVHCQIQPLSQMATPTCSLLLGKCLDTLSDLSPTPSALPALERLTHLKTVEALEAQLFSETFRSLCPVTAQPDWATVVIRYRGQSLDPVALRDYLVSYRNHQGFHEACCEQIFSDIWHWGKPEALAVGCYFARRGGIAISPVRYSCREFGADLETIRLGRQ